MRKLRYFLCGRLFPCALLLLLVVGAGIAVSVFLPQALAPVALAERIFSFGVGLWIVNSPLLPECKTSRLILLVALPWTGAALCLFLRSRAPEIYYPVVRAPFGGDADYFAGISGRFCDLPSCFAESARYFPTGKEMYESLLRDIAQAKRSVWLEYYIVARGACWNGVLSLLEQKARAGADVRLIYDDFGCGLTLPRGYRKQLGARGIKCFAFRPVKFPYRGAGRRDHRKIAVIDGKTAYTGGINLADEYIGEQVRFGHWKDTAVRVTGGAAAIFARAFADTWNKYSPSDKIAAFEENKETCGIPAVVFTDSAEPGAVRTGGHLFPAVFYAARKNLWICTPYLAPDGVLMHALETAAAAGADVRIAIPHVPDKKSVFLLTRSYARKLESAGVKIREYEAGFLHAKSLTADGEFGAVCSYNLDFRSMHLQAECGILLQDKAFSKSLADDFLAVWETGVSLKKASAGEKILGSILKLFAPLI